MLYENNAIYARAHALYGKRLTDRDFKQLAEKKSVGEIAGYLRQETFYADALRDAREESVRRAQLEQMVRRYHNEIYEGLLRYDYSDAFFTRIYAMQQEIRMLLGVLRSVSSGSPPRPPEAPPGWLMRFLSFQPNALMGATDYEKLLEVLRGTCWYEGLRTLYPVAGEALNLPACEAALYTCYYQTSLKLVRANRRGKVRRDMESLLNMRIDMYNIQVIYRLKRFFHFSEAELRACILGVQGSLSREVYDEMVRAEDVETLLKVLRRIRILRRFLTGREENVETILRSMRRTVSHRLFRYSSGPMVVLMSYMSLLEMEGENLINVIEGVRYQLPPEEIRELLIL